MMAIDNGSTEEKASGFGDRRRTERPAPAAKWRTHMRNTEVPSRNR